MPALAPPPARLLIHAGEGGSAGRSLLQRLCRPPQPATTLHIEDLQGRRFLDVDACDAGAIRVLIDVPLPAGTYHVSVRLGAGQRRYTVTLQHGSTVDLYLRR